MKEHLTLIRTTVPDQLQTQERTYGAPDRRYEVGNIWDHKNIFLRTVQKHCLLNSSPKYSLDFRRDTTQNAMVWVHLP